MEAELVGSIGNLELAESLHEFVFLQVAQWCSFRMYIKTQVWKWKFLMEFSEHTVRCGDKEATQFYTSIIT